MDKYGGAMSSEIRFFLPAPRFLRFQGVMLYRCFSCLRRDMSRTWLESADTDADSNPRWTEILGAVTVNPKGVSALRAQIGAD